MNTKQVLYDALKSQLEIKEQEYKLFHETVITPAIEELNNEIKQFLNTLMPIDDIDFDINSTRITVRNVKNGSWDRCIDLELQSNYKNDTKYININWFSGSFNMVEKIQNKVFAEVVSACTNNLETIENEWINNWYEKRRQIVKNDNDKNREFTDLQSALNNLKNEIVYDARESMKQTGFEIKKFKDVYDLDWDYIKDENGDNKREYKISRSYKAIRLQIGRSQWDTVYVTGFKVLGKKGNKYDVEVYREGNSHGKDYKVLEKKFDSFIDEVSNWETKIADKRKDEVEESYKKYS